MTLILIFIFIVIVLQILQKFYIQGTLIRNVIMSIMYTLKGIIEDWINGYQEIGM